MKLRIRGNSLRLRLGRSEVSRLLEGACVEEATGFAPGQRLHYALRTSGEVAEPRASFLEGRIEVLLPVAAVRDWAAGEEVGISAEQAIGAGAERLRLLIEKDFECLNAPATEEQADAFPHPLQGTACPPVGGGE